ncbi:MAG: Holliday junction resolvase RuvX [Patescibacteria group bacterium]
MIEKKTIKYLGIDWGSKRIGLAIGHSETGLATPYKVVGNMREIVDIIKSEEINEVIIGEPLKMENSKMKVQLEFLNFLSDLKRKINIPVITFDERLTSKSADKLSKDKKNKAPRDAIAAMLILQTYLDKLNTNNTKKNERNEL